MKNTAKILIVDDEPLNVDYIQQELEDLDCETIGASNGREALERVAAAVPDVILLDIMMPEMDGFEVLAKVKSSEAWRDIPVIVISALHDMDSVVRGIKMGAEDYLPKPFDPVLLKARIEACLERKRLRDREVQYIERIEAEKQRADELLRVILPDEIVAELKATGAVTPRRHDDVAVLFADVVDFTPYCEAHSPEEIMHNLQLLVDAFESLAARHGLEKVRTVGDEFVATGGLLKPLDNPVLGCVRCGLQMIKATATLPAQWRVRVGVHLGSLIAAVVGHRKYLFDVFGDTVNTAHRIQSHGLADAVNLSSAAWQQVSTRFTAESLGCVPVKGKGELEIFCISTVATRAKGHADLDR